ncbi:hypothetical protein ACR78G_16885 [Sphingobacterium spiritivorum]|uniref:hypothetical protein n=1 Tax=Sphingobacterium spiritivorum TaxID=258 RepID=UPI003DA612E0
MTFEEFFVKKNIDLSALQHSNSALYDEFKKHYMLMGEKSFDHTKKFWFNRLRKDYKLAEQEISPAVVKKTETQVASSASGGIASKPAGFRPKFKSAAPPVTDNDPAAESTSAEARPATGFTPRFKSNSTPANADQKESSAPQPAPSNAPAGFKPRFKPGVTNTKTDPEESASSEKDNTQETANKPAGFKPRFKAGITAPKKEDKFPQAESTAIENKETTETPPATAEDNKEAPQTPAKPLGFRPKFKAGVTTVKKEQEEQNPQTESTVINKETTETPFAATAEDNKEAPQTPAKPLGFRPKFKAGVTTVKKEQEEQNPQTESTGIENKETIEIPSSATAEDNKEAPQTPPKPLGFRPKFKAGVTKIQKNDDNQRSED